MHNHSDKVEPKKVVITVVLLILLLGYAYITRNDRSDHAQEEIRIHQEIIEEAGGDVKHLAEKHLADTIEIHKRFWKDLEKSWKNK